MFKHCFGALAFTLSVTFAMAQPQLLLETFATGLSNPVDIASAGDDRMFVVERLGHIKIVDALGNVNPVDFLDIHDLIESGYQEQGLLGLAFHPDYALNGWFYVNYTDVDGNTTVSRFSVSAGDPDIADPASEVIVLTVDQPYVNHNGGCIKFGPDGYLYIGMGDGGSAGDPGDRAQDPLNRLGKIMRIDVDGALPFEIPADNPFAAATDTLNEIWAIGYRNPWRYSFDRLTGNMWVGDVGQNLHEEIDVENAGSGGHNYGWRCYEGFSEFNPAGCSEDTSYVFPILDYPHNYTTGGFAITGGFVYRGTEFPGMYGYYICADYVSGNWWWVNADGGIPWTYEKVDDVHSNISCFGENTAGELYCGDLGAGIIYHVTDACGDFMLATEATDYICGVQDGAVDLSITSGTAPFDFVWSEGSLTEDISGLVAGTYTVTVTDNVGCERTATAVVYDIPPFEAIISVAGNTLSVATGTAWQWYLDAVEIVGATANTYTATEDGNYSCYVTDALGCSVWSDTVALVVNGIISSDPAHTVILYPDPAQDFMQVRLFTDVNIPAVELQVTSIDGKIIYTTTIAFVAGENNFSINTNHLQSGLYLLVIKAGAGGMSKKFAVMK